MPVNPETGRVSRRSAAMAANARKGAIKAKGAAIRRNVIMEASCGSRYRFDAANVLGGFTGGTDAQRAPDIEGHLEGAFGGRLADGDIARFAPGTRVALSVQVQVRAGMPQYRLPPRLAIAQD